MAGYFEMEERSLNVRSSNCTIGWKESVHLLSKGTTPARPRYVSPHRGCSALGRAVQLSIDGTVTNM